MAIGSIFQMASTAVDRSGRLLRSPRSLSRSLALLGFGRDHLCGLASGSDRPILVTNPSGKQSLERKLLGNESGQSIIEYILLLAIVVGFFYATYNGIKAWGLPDKFFGAYEQTFAAAYQFGDPRTRQRGADYEYHPRVFSDAQGNFRIFYYRPREE
jgi:hypothetical protein